MKKVTITLGDKIWKWWKDNPWINLSQLAERELNRIRMLEERVLGTCPECGNPVDDLERKTKFTDIVINLNQVGIEDYLERVISSVESIDSCVKQEDAVLRIEFSDTKKLTIAWPEYASPRLQAGLFFAEPRIDG